MPKSFEYVWLIPLLPLIAAVATPFLRGVLGKQAHWPTLAGTAVAFLVALSVLWSATGLAAWKDAAIVPVVSDWLALGGFKVGLNLLIDPLSALFLVTITGVGLMVVVFSVGYMADEDDAGYAQYFSVVGLFLFSMCMLVLADNFVVMYVFWEGVGLCSYLLVGYYFTKPAAADAARKAFLVNRIGDAGLAIGILLIWSAFGSVSYNEVFAVAKNKALWGDAVTYSGLAAICLLLFWGCCGKSAQIPLYTWLPDAMEGPTPVSALIHAATMVTAGVYLVARCTPLFFPGADGGWPSDWSLTPPDAVALVGAATALFAATIAVCQYDLKKILAYSTVSQLGYMFLALGCGATGAAVFHVHTHAFFKAALFLSAGVVMHATHGEIDIRKIGGLRGQLRTTFLVFCVAGAALAGVPLTAGFFSKDAVIAGAFVRDDLLGILALLAALMTAFYTFRMIFVAFMGREKMPTELHGHLHQPSLWMTGPIVVLAVLSVVGGWYGIGGETHIGPLGNFLQQTPRTGVANGPNAPRVVPLPLPTAPAMSPSTSSVGDSATPEVTATPEAAATPELQISTVEHPHGPSTWMVMLLSTLAAGLGIWAAYSLFVELRVGPTWPPGQPELVATLENKYWVDEAYELVVVAPMVWLGGVLRIFDAVAVTGATWAVATVPVAVGTVLRFAQTGYFQGYALYTVLGLALLGLYLLRLVR